MTHFARHNPANMAQRTITNDLAVSAQPARRALGILTIAPAVGG
jgi:hypothetical protein